MKKYDENEKGKNVYLKRGKKLSKASDQSKKSVPLTEGSKATNAAGEWLTARFLSVATILFGGLATFAMIMLMIQADHVSYNFKDLDFDGMKTFIQLFPIIFWLVLAIVIVLLGLSVYRYVQVKKEKINLLYAVSYGIEAFLIFNLKDLKNLASSINSESISDMLNYGASAYENLNNLKITAVCLLFMSLFIFFVGITPIIRKKA